MTQGLTVDLSVELGDLLLRNPVIAASGVFGYGEEYCRLGDLQWFGAVTVKGTTLRPRPGNPPPRICETPSGMLNSIGLENPGARAVIEEKLPWLAGFGVPVIVNVSGDTYEDFEELGAMFQGAHGVFALELNVSCPNVQAGGIAFGVDSRSCYRAVRSVRKTWKGPLLVKLTPTAPDLVAVARAAVEGGATVISLVNTIPGMAIDARSKKAVLGTVTGGLSGPAIKPVALRCVYQVSQAVEVPVVGMGGIVSSEDALEFMMAGASAVAVGSGLLVDPELPLKITSGLKEYACAHGLCDLKQVVGAAWQ